MKVETGIPTNDLRDAGRVAAQMEALGYDGIVTPEIKNDPFLPLAAAAITTERVTLGTAVAIAFPRSPMITALMSWDIQRASGGRFILGLGSQVKGHVQRRYSAFWSGHPQPQMREYIQALQAIWHTWETGDIIMLPVKPEGTTHQHVNADPERPARLLVAEPNFVDSLGVDLGAGFEQVADAPTD